MLKKLRKKIAEKAAPQNEISSPKAEDTNKSRQKHFQKRPRICLIDTEQESVEGLESHGFNCYPGTFGPLVEVPNTGQIRQHQCLLTLDFPQNLHEYDIVVVDLQTQKKVQYVAEEHIRSEWKGHRQRAFLSSFPETLFDPRPRASDFLRVCLQPLMQKDSILLVFADEVEYFPVSITPDGVETHKAETYSLYSFFPKLPSFQNLMGEDIKVVTEAGEITALLQQYVKEATYRIVFDHPTHREEGKTVKDDNFLPLMLASNGKIVSFVYCVGKNYSFFFPFIKKKKEFLLDLFQRVFPSNFPTLFPYSTQFAWLNDPIYRLPNEAALLEQRRQLEQEYKNKLNQLDNKLESNRTEYGFLHELLTESGSKLVKTVEGYLRWLGFQDVVNADETEPEMREEDLRIETTKGLLVMEVKGIGGTSSDSECSQISKIKYRRSKQRGKFDVYGLYLVNHQRFLPPEKRINPPFNAQQIQDAKNDERGVLSTYDLFKLYFNIDLGFVTKEDACASLFQFGLVEFRPSNAVMIPPPYELHYGGHVAIFKLDHIQISNGMNVILNDSGWYRVAKIAEIQVEGKPVETANSGKVGVKLTEKASKNTEIWLRLEQLR